MRVCITGVAGFVGHHIAKAFIYAGHSVFGVDDLQARVDMTPRGVDFLKKNTRHLGLHDLKGVDFVVHAAARADVSMNWEATAERSKLWLENIEGTIGLLEVMPETAGIVFFSTGAVYGDTSLGFPGEEADACVATSPYAASKLAGEALVQAYCYKRNVPWCVFRPGCIVGEGLHHGHAADFVNAVKKTGKIHAKNDGYAKKSFVHVLDVADACVAVATDREHIPDIHNLTKEPWSWRDTVAVMRKMRPDIPFEVTYEERMHGWVGDPMAILSPARCFIAPRRTVEEGVMDALISLGWSK